MARPTHQVAAKYVRMYQDIAKMGYEIGYKVVIWL